ncbi:MAG TPA: phosphoglycerate dehydrogenase [Gemmatimonadales bacterium]
MTFVVVVADQLNEAGLGLLRDTPGFEVVVTTGDRNALARALPDAHALLVRSDTQVTAGLIAMAPSLRVIGRAGIGVDNIDVPAATRAGIAVLNAPGANTVSAAEHAVALLLSLVRRVPWAVESMRRGEWDRKAFAGSELRGKTLGIVGLGRIGAHISKIAVAIGMHVVAHDPFLTEKRARALSVDLVSLDDLLREVDVVTLHLPLTDDTRHLIDAERLALMKPSAVLINTARGELVDEDALVAAVTGGVIAGAAVDVYSQEPLPGDSPLRRTDRILLTPHLAASTAEAQERVATEICTSIRDALVSGDVGKAINVAGVSSKAMSRLRPFLELARQIGSLAATLSRGRVEAIEVHYGGADDDAPRPTEVAAVEGALTAMGVAPVTLVNAVALAGERGIALSRRAGQALSGFQMTVGVTIHTDSGASRVVGALVGEGQGAKRIVRIGEFSVDVPAEGYILVLRNRDVPGVVGQVGTVLGEVATNIASYHQSRHVLNGVAGALAAIVVDQPPATEVIERLAALPDVMDVRVASLGAWGRAG